MSHSGAPEPRLEFGINSWGSWGWGGGGWEGHWVEGAEAWRGSGLLDPPWVGSEKVGHSLRSLCE